jgi:hypothetical protein
VALAVSAAAVTIAPKASVGVSGLIIELLSPWNDGR